MSNQYINFYYDPTRQGFDTEAWSVLDGVAPVVNGGRLAVNYSTITHYGDIIRGCFKFNLNIPHAPIAGDNRIFGLYQYNKGAYLAFNITGAVFTATSGDGNGNTNSVAITWQSAWTATDTEYTVKWEAGLAHFYVGGVLQAAISDASITGDPMSLYVSNNTADNLNLKYIDAKSIQSYYLNTPLVGSQVFGRLILTADNLTISESVVMAMTFVQSLSESLAITENLTLTYGAGNIPGKNVSDALTVSESVTMNFGPGFLGGNTKFEALSVAESVTIAMATETINVNDALTYTEFVGLQAPF